MALRPKLEQWLDEGVRTDILEGPIDSAASHDYVSNLVVTGKKWSDSERRFNLDMRNANKDIIRVHFPIPTIQELRHELAGFAKASQLDLKHGYHQVLLDRKSRRLTTFHTHKGLYRFKVLVMGCSPASEEFHEKLRIALTGLKGVIQIQDDILVHGKTQAEHDERLEALLKRLEERGLTLRKEKCRFDQTQLIWFGYLFTPTGMYADPNKVAALAEAPDPKSRDEVRSLLQTIQFNAPFIAPEAYGYGTYADLTEPMRESTKGSGPFQWTPACKNAMRAIRTLLTSEMVIAPCC